MSPSEVDLQIANEARKLHESSHQPGKGQGRSGRHPVTSSIGDNNPAMLSDLAGMVERDIIAVQRAVSDQLTRISNRRGFLAFSKYSLELHRRQLVPATLVFFDLDTFKPINDPHGHAEGDGVLTLFSEQMRDSFLSSDLFARLGGDAFVALLTNADSDVVVTTRGSRFTDGLQHRCAALSLPYSIAFSYGLVSCEPLKHSSVVDMLHEADSAMDRGKRAKR